jgi:hypothetical protein
MGTRRKLWYGDVKSHDDFGSKISKTFIDGRTKHGPWAIMTPKNHRLHGVGLGEGRGQQYDLQEDGKWEQPESAQKRKAEAPAQPKML